MNGRIAVPVPCQNPACSVAEMRFDVPRVPGHYTFDCPICATPGTLNLQIGGKRGRSA